MPLLNVTVVSSNKGHIPWTVVQIEPGLTFVQLFQKILSGSHPMLVIEDQALSKSALVGQCRDTLSMVDEKLVVDDVCSVFGQHVKFVVV